jgi:hypothetical protein
MAKNGTIAYVSTLPKCDLCPASCRNDAEYDFQTQMGSWAFGCSAHWKEYRASEKLGIGKGQRLEIRRAAQTKENAS